MKKLLLILTLFIGLYAQAQDIKSCFIAMPDSLSALLTKVNREDFGDFLASNMKAEVKNRFGLPSEMLKMTDDYLLLNVSKSSTLEMKMLPVNDSTKVICAVSTYKGPAEDSQIKFYTADWKELPAADFISFPREDDFYRLPADSVSSDSLASLRRYADMFLVKASLSASDKTLSFRYTTPDYLDKDTRQSLRTFCPDVPVVYEWRGGRFERIKE